MGTTNFDLGALLQHLMEQRGSDLHLKAGSPPHVRVDGRLRALPYDSVRSADTERIAYSIMPVERADELDAGHETDFAHSVPGLGRFRVNAFQQRGSLALVFRRVAPGCPTFASLGLPEVVRDLVDHDRGLVLVTGPAGSGTTTTVASLIDHINEHRAVNIVTIEDPVEVLHHDKLALVSQREVGSDTAGFAEAMRRVIRQDPDVIFVGEMRDTETAAAALAAAETGHLVLTTMHTVGAAETVQRVVDLFPSHQHPQVRASLAASLRGVASQRLVERSDRHGRVPVTEVLVGTQEVQHCLLSPGEPLMDALEAVVAGGAEGMHTFDQSLATAVQAGEVAAEVAVANAVRPAALQAGLAGRRPIPAT